MDFLKSAIKLIVGCFLFGLVFLANPIPGYCESSNLGLLFPRGSYTTPAYITSNDFYKNINSNGPVTQYGLVPYSVFDIDLSFQFQFGINDYLSALGDGYIYCDVYILFSSSDNYAYQKPLFSSILQLSIEGNKYSTIPYNFHFRSDVEGIPTGLRFHFYNGQLVLKDSPKLVDGYTTSDPHTYDINVTGTALYSFTNFSFDGSSSGTSSSTIINNVNSNLTPIGYSSLNFGVNGNVYFLEDNYIFKPDYISPLMFLYDFYNSLSGTVGSSSLTLCMGDIASVSPVRGSPIAVIGDTRQGEYELTLGFCLGSAPSSSELSALTNLSNWGFEFNRGYSGDQFPMPSDARVSYTNFLDTSKNLYYVNVYFYFTTPDYFDSFLIRKAPTLRNIRVGAFAFNKYTGTISDQITVINEQWDSQIPNHSGFTSANSGASSAVSAMSGIESSSFGALNSAMSGASIDNFSLSTMSTPITTVSGLINQTYNILPSSIKWLITAILVIGILACIVSASRYTNTD